MGGFGVDPNALEETAQGISDTIGELKSVGMAVTAEEGHGFSNLALTGEQAGHPDVQGALDQFCQRWTWGVRTLVQDGNQFAQQLHLSAGAYHDMEDYAVGTLKDIAVDLGGDPHAQDEQVEGQSWGQLAQKDMPDYSPQSWDQAGHEMAQQWQAEGRDLQDPSGLAQEMGNVPGGGIGIDGAPQVFQQQEESSGPAPGQGGG